MKDRRYANKGATLEEFISFSNVQYRRSKEAVIWKVPTHIVPIRGYDGRIVNAKIEEKSCVDYLGRVNQHPIAIEAKETSKDNISFDRVEDHQAEFLDDFTEQGIGLVVVAFSLTNFYAIPWKFWKTARDAWEEARKKRTRKADKIEVEHNGQTWITPGKASVREEELLPEWKIPTGGRYGLDYLRDYRTPTVSTETPQI